MIRRLKKLPSSLDRPEREDSLAPTPDRLGRSLAQLPQLKPQSTSINLARMQQQQQQRKTELKATAEPKTAPAVGQPGYRVADGRPIDRLLDTRSLQFSSGHSARS